jgi:hypothetical protein
LLGNRVPFPPRFELGPLDGIRLEKVIELSARSPVAIEIVVFQVAIGQVADDRIAPAVQANGEPGFGAAEKLHRFVLRLGKSQPLAGRRDRYRIADLRLDLHDVRQLNLLQLIGMT